MRKIRSVLLFVGILLSLASCGSKEPAPFSPADAPALMDSGAFSDELFEVGTDVICPLFSVEEDQVKEGVMYTSTGTSAEELLLLVLTDQDAAQRFCSGMQGYLDLKTKAMADYLPNEVPKLEQAVLERRGATVLFAVAADYGPIQKYLER